jgi:hypothetical protein
MGETIQIEVSSLSYYAFAGVAARLALEAPVRLVREPGNEWDARAIRVELEDGTHLGYVEKGVNGWLAALLDPLGGSAAAFIAALEGGLHAEQPRLRIAFVLPEDAADPWGGSVSGYCFQPQGDAGYLLVDCARTTLARVSEALGPLAGSEPRFGASTKPAPDGRRYRWFVRLVPAAGGDAAALETELDRRMEDRFDVRSHARLLREARAAEQEKLATVREFERESGAKELELAEARKESEFYRQTAESYRGDAFEAQAQEKKLRDRVLALEAEVEGRRRRAGELQRDFEEQRRAREELEAQSSPGTAAPGGEPLTLEQVGFVLQHTCPPLQLLRDSADAIARLPNQGPVLRELSRLDQSDVKGERLEGAPGWCERHFSTGHGNDGRLYYRRRGNRAEVLVSTKPLQARDVRYLAGL